MGLPTRLVSGAERDHRDAMCSDISDILFSNIKHLFFQPSEKELIVLIHVNLVSPIMIGKKKTYVSPAIPVSPTFP